MSNKGSNFFEEHAEKLVLAIVGLISLWLLISYVVVSPNYIKYDNEKLSAGNIDDYISKQSMLLENKLGQEPVKGEAYEPRFDDFSARIDSSINGIDVSLYLPQPNRTLKGPVDKRVYSIPQVGKINDVEVGHIRAVVYVPTQVISEDNPYEVSGHEPGDVDFVTVAAKYDVGGLYERFYYNFAGEGVRDPQWSDPCLATPVFASVQLQRQQLQSDGRWGDWEVVPRTRIDHRKELFEVIEDVKELPPGGMKVRLLQFNDAQIKKDMLQPKAYQIASPKEEWFPPSLYKDFLRYRQGMEAQAKREARAKAAEEDQRDRGGRGLRVARRKPLDIRGRSSQSIDADESSSSGGGSARRFARRNRLEKEQEEKEVTLDDIYSKFKEISITEKTDFPKMEEEPLLFWAHDDTVEPGKSYKYRIRLGVFNPLAGTDQFVTAEEHLRNNVILWSDFSEPTDVIEIPAMLYLFPCDIYEATKNVTVTVSRYLLGYWYNKDFTVKRGEIIGKMTESEMVYDDGAPEIPQAIDYSTGAVFVDAVTVNDWAGTKNLRARHYYDMLYSFDGISVERLPIKTRYWPDELKSKFNEVKKSEKQPREKLRAWDSTIIYRKQTTSSVQDADSADED